MIAIGAQCHGPDRDDIVEAAELFSYARKMALEKMLENPSLELVRVFLLMAFYMLGACRRNPAFMYLGVASKAADILGLHTSAHSSYMSSALRNTRYVRIPTRLRIQQDHSLTHMFLLQGSASQRVYVYLMSSAIPSLAELVMPYLYGRAVPAILITRQL